MIPKPPPALVILSKKVTRCGLASQRITYITFPVNSDIANMSSARAKKDRSAVNATFLRMTGKLDVGIVRKSSVKQMPRAPT